MYKTFMVVMLLVCFVLLIVGFHDAFIHGMCCFIGCEKAATWQVWDGPRPDDYIEACDDHLGHLLSDASEHRVLPLLEKSQVA